MTLYLKIYINFRLSRRINERTNRYDHIFEFICLFAYLFIDVLRFLSLPNYRLYKQKFTIAHIDY